MLDQLLQGDMKDTILKALVAKLGVDESQAGSFLEKAVSMISGLMQGGELDPTALLGGDISALTSKLDMGSLAGALGGDAGKADTGLRTLMDQVSGDAAGGLLGKLGDLGGGGDALKGIAGKFLGG